MPTPPTRSTGSGEPCSIAPRSWDVGAISRALDSAPALSDRSGFGPGLRYRLGEGGALTVDLFPPNAAHRTGIACFSTVDLDLILFRQSMPAVAEDGLLFRTDNHVLAVDASGSLHLYRAAA